MAQVLCSISQESGSDQEGLVALVSQDVAKHAGKAEGSHSRLLHFVYFSCHIAFCGQKPKEYDLSDIVLGNALVSLGRRSWK